jgi:hypothetical protein
LAIFAIGLSSTLEVQAAGLCAELFYLLNPAVKKVVALKKQRAKELFNPIEARNLIKDQSHLGKFSNEVVSLKKPVSELGEGNRELRVSEKEFEKYERDIVPNSIEVLHLSSGKMGGEIMSMRIGNDVYSFSSLTGVEKEPFRYYLSTRDRNMVLTGNLIEVSPREMQVARLFFEGRLAGMSYPHNIYLNNCSHMVCGALKAAELPVTDRFTATRPSNLMEFLREQSRTVATIQHHSRPEIDRYPYFFSERIEGITGQSSEGAQ